MDKIYFEKIEGYDVKMPAYGTQFSAGIDCCLPNYTDEQARDMLEGCDIVRLEDGKMRIIIHPDQIVKIPLGLKCAFDNKYVLMAKNRSGLSLKGLTKLAQVVDSDYRGQLFVSLYNCGREKIKLDAGDRIIQFVLVPYIHAEIHEGIPDELKDTERGAGGFGSTGR